MSDDGRLRTLTVVVPLHNVGTNADRLLARLARIGEEAIDVVLVDDGSTDGTAERLRAWMRQARCRAQVIVQDNRGPGGARNRGLAAATGDYVWFVDADDDFDDAALAGFRAHAGEDQDFIEIGVRETAGAVPGTGRVADFPLPPGAYEVDADIRRRLLDRFGRMFTKMYRRAMLVEARVGMPEYCIYEDTPWFFELPLLVRRFRVLPGAAYVYHREQLSVTRVRGAKPPRFFDRLPTAAYAVALARRHALTPAEQRIVERKFLNIALVHTASFVWAANRDWRTMLRVMRWCRDAAARLGIARDPRSLVSGSRAYRLLFAALWQASRALPSQNKHFARLHERAWRRPIAWPDPKAAAIVEGRGQ